MAMDEQEIVITMYDATRGTMTGPMTLKETTEYKNAPKKRRRRLGKRFRDNINREDRVSSGDSGCYGQGPLFVLYDILYRFNDNTSHIME